MRSLVAAAAVLCLPVLPAFQPLHAQSADATPAGTVTGHVFLGDSQRPARFATVEILQESQPDPNSPANFRGPRYNAVASARTAMDGSFAISGIAPGDYSVTANQTGYIDAAAAARAANGPLTHVATVHVQGSGASDVNVTLERGGVLAGRVQYDDGTPVPGVFVQVRVPNSSAPAGNGFRFNFRTVGQTQPTDDRGNFRITGLPAGQYFVAVNVPTEGVNFVNNSNGGRRGAGGFRGGNSSVITEFAPGVMGQAQARSVDVRAGSEVTGVDIVVKLNGLHTVTGTVVNKADGQPLNAGFVTLTDTSDSSFTRRATVQPDGTFTLEYVPSGSYTLNASGSLRQIDSNGRMSGNTSFQPSTMTVSVGDGDAALGAVQLSANSVSGK